MVTGGDPFVGSGWCCGICFDVGRLLARGRTVDDITDATALAVTSLGRRLRAHGHNDLADRVNPGGRRTAPTQQAFTLEGVA